MQIIAAFSGSSIRDIEETREFYSEILGLHVEDAMGGISVHLPDSSTHYLYQKDDHIPASFTILNFIVENIEAAIDELSEKGVVFSRYDNLPAQQDERGILRGKDEGMGPDIAWFSDPSGNILSLIEE